MKRMHYFIASVFLIISSGIVYIYLIIYGIQIRKDTDFYIRYSDDIHQVLKNLNSICDDVNDLKKVFFLKGVKRVKPGKYILRNGMNANEIINIFYSGNQVHMNVFVNNQHYIENVSGKLSKQIEADSIHILKSFTDADFLKKNGLNEKTVLNICMPYMHECYWTISPDQLRQKFLSAYKNFWNEERLLKAKRLNLSRNEVISLAAIVDRETSVKEEKRRIAGVYLNRIRMKMFLQADPTVVYVLREKYGRSTVVNRVLKKDINIVSPYNTYKTKGLPPSAISMASIDAIEAVLNSEKHDYYYFCASLDRIGSHDFSRNFKEHLKKARRYQQRLNERKIYR